MADNVIALDDYRRSQVNLRPESLERSRFLWDLDYRARVMAENERAVTVERTAETAAIDAFREQLAGTRKVSASDFARHTACPHVDPFDRISVIAEAPCCSFIRAALRRIESGS